MKRAPSLLLVAASWLLSGCRCSDDKPYTPFGTTTALPPPEPAASLGTAPSASASAAPPAVERSVLAPAKSTRWQLGGQDLEAPPGYVFEQGVRASFGDGAPSALAWLVADGADAGAIAPGELWLYPSAGAPRRLLALPGFVPTAPGCKLTTSLSRTGPHSATLDTGASCATAMVARSPARAVVVVAPEADHPEVLSLRLAAPAPGEQLEPLASTADRDGDGRDDVTITFSGGLPGSSVSAPFIWLDRAVGLSRDSAEPQRSLVRLAGREAARAKTKKVAEDVLRTVGSIRRLMASLCAEGATPRLLDADANPIPCGSASAVVDSLATAEVTANLTLGRVLEAFGALSRDGWYFGKASATTRQKLERQLLDAIEPVTAVVKTLEPRPAGLERTPRMSPIAFDAAGGVLVSTATGVVATAPDGSSPVPAAESLARSLDVLAAPGQRWIGTTFSCDRSEVMLALEGTAPLPTTLLSPRPGACGHASFWASEAPPVLGAKGGHVAAIVGGTVVGVPEPPYPPGSARSSNGAWTVVPTSLGLLVEGAAHRLVSLGTSVPEPLRLTDCVVSDSGKSIACVEKHQAILVQVP